MPGRRGRDQRVEAQSGDRASTLALYRAALARAARGAVVRVAREPAGTLVFERGEISSASSTSAAPALDLPDGELVLASEPEDRRHCRRTPPPGCACQIVGDRRHMKTSLGIWAFG